VNGGRVLPLPRESRDVLVVAEGRHRATALVFDLAIEASGRGRKTGGMSKPLPRDSASDGSASVASSIVQARLGPLDVARSDNELGSTEEVLWLGASPLISDSEES
jgi:hypothetical protein